ncbi:MAG: hypothetical protein COC19_08410, partial [SAR86 cluster bacterium]
DKLITDAATQLSALEKIANYADDSTNPEPSVTDYTAAGVSGVDADNVAAVNELVDAVAKVDADTVVEVDALIANAAAQLMALEKIANYADDNSNDVPTLGDYVAAGVSGVDASNLDGVNELVDGVSKTEADTVAEIDALVAVDAAQLAALEKIANYADDSDANPVPTLFDYTTAGVSGVDGVNLAAVNQLIDAVGKAQADTVIEIDGIIAGASAQLTALEKIANYADDSSNGVPTLADYVAAGVSGVDADNLAGVNELIDEASRTQADTVTEVDAIIAAATTKLTALEKIAAYADSNSNPIPTLADYMAAIVTGITSSNVAAINSALDDADITATQADSAAKIQMIVDAYAAIITSADGGIEDGTDPSKTQYDAIGVNGVNDDVEELKLLGEVIDGKSYADIDTVEEVQGYAEAVQAVMSAANGTASEPTLADLQLLGVVGISAENLVAVQIAIAATADNGSEVDTLAALNSLVAAVVIAAVNTLKDAAQANTAVSTLVATDYETAGVTGVTSSNVGAINSALDDADIVGTDADTAVKVQTIVDAYAVIITAADGGTVDATDPTKEQYEAIGVNGVTTDVEELKLLGEVIDAKTYADIDTVTEIQGYLESVQGVMAGANGTVSKPTLEDLQDIGVSGISAGNLAAVQAVIAATNNDGTGVDSIGKLNNIVAGVAASAIGRLANAAENDTAVSIPMLESDYATAGVTGVTSSNVGAINSALDDADIIGTDADTAVEIQTIVDSYEAIITAADGGTADATDPTKEQYEAIGVNGVTTDVEELKLLGEVIDGKVYADIDTVVEVQGYLEAVQAVMAGANGTASEPTLADLQDIGVNGISAGNLAAVQALIAATNNDGTGVDSIGKLNNMVAGVIFGAIGKLADAAQNDTAVDIPLLVTDYGTAGVTGVTSSNVDAINSALDDADIIGTDADTAAKVQLIVDAYAVIITAADGGAVDATDPTKAQYEAIGVNGVSTDVEELRLLGEVIDAKSYADIDTVEEVQGYLEAVQAVMSAANGTASELTLADLQKLGVVGMTTDNLAAVQAAIAATADDGSQVDTLTELNNLVATVVTTAVNKLKDAAQNNTAVSTPLTTTDYGTAGVSGVTSSNIDAINSALDDGDITGTEADTTVKVQSIVDAYAAIIIAADGGTVNATDPTKAQYDAIGLNGVTTDAEELKLLGEVIDGKVYADIDTVAEVQEYLEAVQGVMAGAAGAASEPTLADFQKLEIVGINADNLVAVQTAIAATANNGLEVDTLAELNSLVATVVTAAVNKLKDAAQDNTAVSTLAEADYGAAGVTGVTSSNLGAINSALDDGDITGTEADTAVEVQAIVDAYAVIITAADGGTVDATDPTKAQYDAIGVNGVNDDAEELKLLGEVIDGKVYADIDTVAEIQAYLEAVQGVMAGANGTASEPTLVDLQVLGINDISADNLAAVQAVIAATNNDGTGVDSIGKLNNLVAGVVSGAIGKLADAAENDTAVSIPLLAGDYNTAGVIGVTSSNVDAINSVLDDSDITDAEADTAAKVQTIVDAYAAIITAADGGTVDAADPTKAQYEAIGVNGVTTDVEELKLLGEVIDGKVYADIDTVAEVQGYVEAVQAVMTAANGTASEPTLTDLQLLGVVGITAENLVAVQTAIAATADDGSEVDTLADLNSLVATVVTTAVNKLKDAAQANAAVSTPLTVIDYGTAGVTGVTSSNIGAINSALDDGDITGTEADTAAKVQTIVDAYAAIITAADGGAVDATDPSKAQYDAIGVNGVTTDVQELKLLGEVIDAKTYDDIDTVMEVQGYLEAVQAVMSAANGTASEPSLSDLQQIGIVGITAENLAAVQTAIAATA